MSAPVECPVCGASGNAQCSSRNGRDHKARWRAEEAARAATRPAPERRPWNGQAVGRVVAAEGRRIARSGTEHDLAELASVRAILEDAMRVAVTGLIEREAGWAGIGEALGVTKSAAFQRYAPKKQAV